MNIRNDQGFRPAVVDAVAPFLLAVKDILPLFEEPDVYVGDGAFVASLHLTSKYQMLSGNVLGTILDAAREGGFPVCASVFGDQKITINVYGFVIF